MTDDLARARRRMVGRADRVAQAKFLRVLREREYQRLGTRPQKASVRVVAASNRDLHHAVERGTFRLLGFTGSQLYVRLRRYGIAHAS